MPFANKSFDPYEYHSDSEIQLSSDSKKRNVSHVIRSVDDYEIMQQLDINDTPKKSYKGKNAAKVSFKCNDNTSDNDKENKDVGDDESRGKRRSKKAKKDKFSEIDLDEEPGYFELDVPIAHEDDPYPQEKRPSVSGTPTESNRIRR